MFVTKRRYESLYQQVKWLDSERDRLLDRIRANEADFQMLANYFGVRITQVNERRIEKTKSPHRSEG